MDKRRTRKAPRRTAAGGNAEIPTTAKVVRLTRAQKTERNRRALMAAAAQIVGESGYAEASVGRITERAGLASGTFYRYFESQQDLFDKLLPSVGLDLMHFLRDRVAGARDFLEVEERGFRGFFEFLDRQPGFYKIVNEAEAMAPNAFWTHTHRLRDHYVASLRRGWENGELPGYDLRELEVIAFILMASRFYLYLRYIKGDGGGTRLPEWVIQAYLKFVTGGLRSRGLPRRPRKAAAGSKPRTRASGRSSAGNA